LGIWNKEIINKLKENGVTYNVYDAEKELVSLEIDPICLHQSEWEIIEKRDLFKELIY
jgi:uncharacterized circularly permuted ATP-grasp superfamily protein